MWNLVGSIYRSILPESLRRQLSLLFKNDDLSKLRRKILIHYRRLQADQISEEQAELISYLKGNPIYVFPYNFQEKYDYRNVTVFLDEDLGLRYVLMEGKRLYFKRKWSEAIIKGCYSFLQMEQDIDSPHRYQINDFLVKEREIVVDIGTAEGNFALSVVEKAGKLILFEPDEEWIEPLEATFYPWKGKVEIVNKFVSAENDKKDTTLDKYIEEKGLGKVHFLKIDVEGAETDLLKGCEKILASHKSLKLVVCTYHKKDDGRIFSELLEKFGFDVSFSKGYMLFIRDLEMQPPYLRRGLIRTQK